MCLGLISIISDMEIGQYHEIWGHFIFDPPSNCSNWIKSDKKFEQFESGSKAKFRTNWVTWPFNVTFISMRNSGGSSIFFAISKVIPRRIWNMPKQLEDLITWFAENHFQKWIKIQFTWFSTNNTKIIKECKNKGPTKYNWHEH